MQRREAQPPIEHIEDLHHVFGHLLVREHERLDREKADLAYWAGPLTRYEQWDEGLAEACEQYGLQPGGKRPARASRRAQITALSAYRDERIQAIKKTLSRIQFNITRLEKMRGTLCTRQEEEEKDVSKPCHPSS